MVAEEVAGYQPEDVLHRSSRTVVWRARRRDGASVVLKAPASTLPTRREAELVRYEFRVLRGLEAPGIVRVYELIEHAGRPMLVLEDIGGISAQRLLLADRPSPAAALRIGAEAAAALGTLHRRGMVHGDVKPANLVVTPSLDRQRLIDFASAAPAREAREATALRGTLAYMAPEQTGRTGAPVDARSDLYSLGVALFELLTGALPFPAADALELVHCHLARRPPPLRSLAPELPEGVEALVDRLLRKPPGERYQSAAGLEADLRRWARQLETGEATLFELGSSDAPEGFEVPRRLYGRDEPLGRLRTAFDRARDEGGAALVRGAAGEGKSALVHALQAHVAAARGAFAAGKASPLHRTPFFAVVEALDDVFLAMLTEPEAEVAAWRQRLGRAWGAGARVMTDLVPSAELLLGPQPEAPELSPAQAENRLSALFAALFDALADSGRPLLLFLDDLQWADPATLRLLSLLGGVERRPGLLLAGAYRGDEVGGELASALDELRAHGADEIQLAPLAEADVAALVADALRQPPEASAALAQLVRSRTGGNPFFVGQFLQALHDDGALRFDPARRRWLCDEALVQRARSTDNVIDLTLERLRRLPPLPLRALRAAACLGARFSTAALAALLPDEHDELPAALAQAADLGLIVALQSDDGPRPFQFLHDRVHQAAYALGDEGERWRWHLAAARWLGRQSDDRDFELANHYNAARPEGDDRAEAARANLRAARASRASAAFESARRYSEAGLALLGGDRGLADPIASALALERAQALAGVGAFAEADALYRALASAASDPVQQAQLHARRQIALAALGRHREVVALACEAASRLGYALPSPDDAPAVEAAIARDLAFLDPWLTDARPWPSPAEALAQPPSPAQAALLRLLFTASTSAFTLGPRVHRALVLAIVRGCFEAGFDASCASCFGSLGHVLNQDRGDLQSGYRLARYGVALAEHAKNPAALARASVMLGGYCSYWAEPVACSRSHLDTGRRLSIETGDLLWASYAASFLIWHREIAGEPLDEIEREAQAHLDFTRRARLDVVSWDALVPLRLIAALRGQTPWLGSLDGPDFDEASAAAAMASLERKTPYSTYLAYKLEALAWAGDFAAALATARALRDRAWSVAGWTHSAKLVFYHALSLAWAAPAPRSADDLAELRSLGRKLSLWARSCPANFEHLALLVAAEEARLTGDDRATTRYEEAADAARRGGFVHDEGLLCEAAARYHLGRGHRRLALALLRDAIGCFTAWGATGKARKLADEHVELLGTTSPASAPPASAWLAASRSTSDTLNTTIDLASVTRAADALGGEVVRSRLLLRLLQILAQNAGAQAGALVVHEESESLVVAAIGSDGEPRSLPPEPLDQSEHVPRSMALLSLRTGNDLAVDDALAHRTFGSDLYVRRHRLRSVLCLHLRQKGQDMGLVVLEHRLAVGAFRERHEVLRLLTTQAAVALENARLYARIDQSRLSLEHQVHQRTAELRERNEHLSATLRMVVEAQQRLAAELSEATAYVQQRLPPPIDLPSLRADWRFVPSAELGGDALGYHALDGHRFALYVLDVCGHGVASALLSVQVLDVLRARRLPGVDFADPAAVVRALNAAFPRATHRDLHFTLWYGVYDASSRRLEYVSAGHPPALLLPPDSPPLELDTGGPFVGIVPDINPPASSCLVPPGSSLYLLSDGTYELCRPDGTMLPFAHFVDAIAASAPDPDALDRIVAFCRSVRGGLPFDDDFSLLELRLP